ncbi:UNVERIFIED_CONTAM: hypothetical protein FKN15_050781 [Acipenser sinensis]
MAQHDFVPAWLNFSTPQPVKSPAPMLEKHGEHFSRGEGRFGVSRRRHNSSDGFFNNGPLHTSGDGWQQPSLLRHDSVDSGVSKGPHAGLISNQGWKENSSWHSAPRGTEAVNHHHHRHRAPHRHWNGSVHPRKGPAFQEKQAAQAREEKGPKGGKLKFVEEDFVRMRIFLEVEDWENPPSAKQSVSKMLVIKKVSKDDPSAAFCAGFAITGPLPANGNKTHVTGPSVYKNLVPKPAAPPTKVCVCVCVCVRACVWQPGAQTKAGPWKPNGREIKSGLHFSGRDSAFTSPVSVTKPLAQMSNSSHTSLKETPSSTTPPMDITPPGGEFAYMLFLKKNGFGKNGLLLKNSSAFQLGHWRSPLELEEGSETETSSSETSADET